MAQLKPSATKS